MAASKDAGETRHSSRPAAVMCASGQSACAMRAEIGSSSTPWKSRARSAGARRMKLPLPQPGSRIAAGVSPWPMPASRSAS